MRWLLVLSVILLAACDDGPREREVIRSLNYCQSDTSDQRADFILKCIQYGNPKADEEPEDWIGMCQDMAEDTLCEKRNHIVTQERIADSWYNRRRIVQPKEELE